MNALRAGLRRRPLAVAGAVLLVAALLLARSAGGGGAAAAGARVVVVTQPVAAGQSLDPSRLRLVDWPAAQTPPGALTRVEDASFRVAAVALPVGLPLVPSLLRAPGSDLGLRQGERAVGVRVDEVGGLAGLLRAGARVDVLVSGPDEDGPVEQLASAAEVLGRPRLAPDGTSWAVALRVPATTAIEIAAAEAGGRRIRLLAREAQ